jgi:hypothetical protein
MEASNNTSSRGLCGGIDAECSMRDAVPRRKISPASEKVERTVRFIVFAGFFLLFYVATMRRVDVLVNLWRCDKLGCAGLQREGRRSCNEARFCTSRSTTWIPNTAG